jgi:hypothetical protein
MFGRGKNKPKKQENENLSGSDKRAREKIAKRILGKDSGRRVFGFACDPDIHTQIKILAGELQVPMFALSEHLLQLSIGMISKAQENPEEREELRSHLVKIHVDKRTVEKFNWYDEELAKALNEKRLIQFEIARTVRQIVVDFARKGMNTRFMPWYLDYGYACYAASVNGRPLPKPSEARFRTKPEAYANHPVKDEEDRSSGGSREQSGQ